MKVLNNKPEAKIKNNKMSYLNIYMLTLQQFLSSPVLITVKSLQHLRYSVLYMKQH